MMMEGPNLGSPLCHWVSSYLGCQIQELSHTHGELKVLNCGADADPEFWDAVYLPVQSGHGAECSITRALVHHSVAQV